MTDSKLLTMQDLIELFLDKDSFEKFISGAETDDVLTRLNVSYPTLKKVIQLFMQNSILNSKPYPTLSSLIADQSTSDGDYGFVYDDGYASNGFYHKSNGQWAISAYSPISADYSVINILDTSGRIENKYIDYQSGVELPARGFFATRFLRVLPNTTYKVSDGYTQQFAFFDGSLQYVGGAPSPDKNGEFVTPATAAYVRMTVNNSLINTLVVAEKSKFPAGYVPYKLVKTINDLSITHDQVIDFTKSVRDAMRVEAINLIDDSKLTDNSYVDFTSGGVGYVIGFKSTDFIAVKPNTEYRASDFYSQQFAFYDANLKYISGMAEPDPSHKFITPSNAAYARFTIKNDWLGALVIAESSKFPNGYVQADKFTIEDLYIPPSTKTVTTIWVSADPNDADPKVKFKGNNAIQNALDTIVDATASNRYIIMVKRGLYKITKATEFLGYRGYPAMILTKNHVDIVGQGMGNTIVWAELPYDDDAIGASVDGNIYGRGQYQTVYDYSDDSMLKDITFFAKNLRYTIHIDNPNGANKERNFDNVAFIFKGNKGSLTAMGCGTSTGERTIINGGVSSSDSNVAFASHNNVAFDEPSYWEFENHHFATLSQPYAIYMQNNGSLVQDELRLVGNSFGGMGYILGYVDVWLSGRTSYNYDCFNHAEWNITGHGNEPFLFENTVAGSSLLFKSQSVGVGNNIRFDTSSTAFDLLIKNNQSNANSGIYVNSRDYVDGYIVQDGSVGLPAKAWGCKDLSESAYLYDNSVNYTSMAKRLGDRTANPVTLTLLVNGTAKNVIFNKNYTAMTNVQIIADMQSQLVGVTVELVSYGRDYYPTITDVCEPVYNNSANFIAKGSLVAKVGGFVRLATTSDKIYGVALDDIPVIQTTADGVKKGQGRVMKKGYMNTNSQASHFVLCDYQNAPIGTKFSVSNGRLVTDINGKISVDVASGIVSINC